MQIYEIKINWRLGCLIIWLLQSRLYTSLANTNRLVTVKILGLKYEIKHLMINKDSQKATDLGRVSMSWHQNAYRLFDDLYLKPNERIYIKMIVFIYIKGIMKIIVWSIYIALVNLFEARASLFYLCGPVLTNHTVIELYCSNVDSWFDVWYQHRQPTPFEMPWM